MLHGQKLWISNKLICQMNRSQKKGGKLMFTSHNGAFNWWITTLTCWLRAKDTIASFPANIPGWERFDTIIHKKKLVIILSFVMSFEFFHYTPSQCSCNLTVLCEGHFILQKRLKVVPVVTNVLNGLLAQTQVTSRVSLQLVPERTEQAVPRGGMGRLTD